MHLHDLWLAMALKCNEKVLPVIDWIPGHPLATHITSSVHLSYSLEGLPPKFPSFLFAMGHLDWPITKKTETWEALPK
jgi:hypothetical protein